jgi:GDP-mannose transporter
LQTLLNKAALSSFKFNAPNAILTFQCAVSVLLVVAFKSLGLIRVEPFNWKVVRVWFPANLIFVGMIVSSFLALKDLGVPMATVLKNMTNLFVILTEYFMNGTTYNAGVWATLVLMTLSAVAGAYTDLAFSTSGYFWQFVNSAFTASNMLYLKVVMAKVKNYTQSGEKLDEFSMVFYNNLLSVPLLLALMVVMGEFSDLANQPDLTNPAFLFVASLTGIIGFSISFSVLWFLSCVTPTTFTLVGSLNKIPVSFIGLFLFETAISMPNVLSVLVGLVAGAVFGYAKSQPAK